MSRIKFRGRMRLPPVSQKEKGHHEVPGYDPQTNVPLLNRNVDSGKVRLNANECGDENRNYAVPSFREYSTQGTPPSLGAAGQQATQ